MIGSERASLLTHSSSLASGVCTSYVRGRDGEKGRRGLPRRPPPINHSLEADEEREREREWEDRVSERGRPWGRRSEQKAHSLFSSSLPPTEMLHCDRASGCAHVLFGCVKMKSHYFVRLASLNGPPRLVPLPAGALSSDIMVLRLYSMRSFNGNACKCTTSVSGSL